MPKLQFRFLPDIPLPSRIAIRDTIGNRIMHRTETPIKTDSAETKHDDPEFFEAGHDNATLVTSMTSTGGHMPVIDLDLPCMLVPSTKPGHFHLYINRAMSFKEMMGILRAMNDAGVVQDGIIEHVERRGYASVRYPGVTKNNEADRIAEAVADIEQIKEETRQKLREDGIIG